MTTSYPSTSWIAPTPTGSTPELVVYNSLTRTKVPFQTSTPGLVTWYNCGPTVYDAAHMGHARNYLTQDIMRRVLRDYFGYEVRFVMNVTDVDDKIIIRARQSHLITQFLSQHTNLSTALPILKSSLTTYTLKALLPSLSPSSSSTPEDPQALLELIEEKEKNNKEWAKVQREREEKWTMYLQAVREGWEAVGKADKGEATVEEVVDKVRDALGAALDKEHGATITDPSIFRTLAAHWEDSFFNSMSSLNVERPTILTRVSEYLPEIVSFVERLVEKQRAYVSEKEDGTGDVWFDSKGYDGSEVGGDCCNGEKHDYAKLQPWSKGNKTLLEDGEGSLTNPFSKRSASDFALWKSSKPGEPAWPSPWGPGRPGWHIECSVMASAVLGAKMDVHSGGVDLAFPHHDNELAQSEAYHSTPQWVSYFLHTGHLHIEGLKMSKSLKNFITIDEALEKYSARQLRLAFLQTPWSGKMDFKEGSMEAVKVLEGSFNNFFANANALLQEAAANSVASDGEHHFGEPELTLLDKLATAQTDFRAALSDSFDTPRAIQLLADLVSTTNIYLSRGRKAVHPAPVEAVGEWVTRMLRMFGLGEGVYVQGKVGWGEKAVEGQESGDKETIVLPYLRAMSEFRDAVRKLAREGASSAEILALTDRLRDSDLVDLGVALDDQDDGRARVKLVNPAVLKAARDEKLAQVAEKAARKQAAKEAEDRKRQEKLERAKVVPGEMFKTPEYSEWNEEGVPTKDKEGVEIGKGKLKKLTKEFEAQKKLHEEYLKSVA